MCKNKEILETTDNASVYKKAFRNLHFKCPMCSPHRGCNHDRSNDHKCWKSNRKTQWK